MATSTVHDMLSDFKKEDLNRILLSLKGEARSATKEDLIEEVSAAAPAKKLEETLSRVECIAPYKHSWLFVLGRGAPKGQGLHRLKLWADELYPDLAKGIDELDSTSAELQPTLQILDEARNRLYVKFTQWVTVRRPIKLDEDTIRWVREQVRHPVVVVLRGDLGIGEVRFNGFSQGRSIKQEHRIPYSTIAIQARELIKERLNIEMRGLPCMDATSLLLKERPTELRHLGSSTRGIKGSMSLRSDDVSAEGDVADYLTSQLGLKSVTPIREALRKMPADSILIEWSNRGTITRISSEMGYTEVLFIWRGEKNNAVTDDIITNLVKAYVALQSSKPDGGVRQYIENLKPGTYFLLSDIVRQFNESAGWVLSIIEDGRKREIIERRFRVRTDKVLEDFRNDWLSAAEDFPEAVTDEDGNELLLNDPKNIEVGYRRT